MNCGKVDLENYTKKKYVNIVKTMRVIAGFWCNTISIIVIFRVTYNQKKITANKNTHFLNIDCLYKDKDITATL